VGNQRLSLSDSSTANEVREFDPHEIDDPEIDGVVSSKNEDRCSIKLALFGTILSLRGFIYTSIDHFVGKNLC
jgi:hypothetical protein